jgi:hypothetical protein
MRLSVTAVAWKYRRLLGAGMMSESGNASCYRWDAMNREIQGLDILPQCMQPVCLTGTTLQNSSVHRMASIDPSAQTFTLASGRRLTPAL